MPPPEPMTTPTIALQALLTSINAKRDALAATSATAAGLDDCEDLVQSCIHIDATLCVAEAIVLASLNTGPAVPS